MRMGRKSLNDPPCSPVRTFARNGGTLRLRPAHYGSGLTQTGPSPGSRRGWLVRVSTQSVSHFTSKVGISASDVNDSPSSSICSTIAMLPGSRVLESTFQLRSNIAEALTIFIVNWLTCVDTRMLMRSPHMWESRRILSPWTSSRIRKFVVSLLPWADPHGSEFRPPPASDTFEYPATLRVGKASMKPSTLFKKPLRL